MKALEVSRLAPGLWRWSVLTPVGPLGSVYFEPEPEGGGGVVVIDPIVPQPGTPESDRFWNALDGDAERMRGPVSILIATPSHTRSAEEVRRRYAARFGAEVLTTEALLSGAALPGNITAHPIEGRDAPEVALFIPRERALVPAEAIIGSGGGRVEIAERGIVSREALLGSLRRLEALEPTMLLPSHGPAVSSDGTLALRGCVGLRGG